MVLVTVPMSKEQRRWLKSYVANEDTNVCALIRAGIEAKLREKGNETVESWKSVCAQGLA